MPTLLIDSSFIGYQALWTVGDLSYKDMPTGVIYEFLGRVRSLGDFFQSNDIVFCWDSPRSYRRKKFPFYKNRPESSPEEAQKRSTLKQQLEVLRTEILPQIGFKNQCFQDGCESDDLMAKIVIGKLGDFILVTSDEDLFQCLAGNVRMFNPSKKTMMTRERFVKEYGIQPNEWAKVKAIGGCTSDTVPGVPGVGEKTALSYLKGTLKPGKKLNDICSASGLNIIKRNMLLVRLPISRAEEPVMEHNSFDMHAFKEVCEKYGITSFLRPEAQTSWQEFFSLHLPKTFKGGLLGPVRTPRRRREDPATTEYNISRTL